MQVLCPLSNMNDADLSRELSLLVLFWHLCHVRNWTKYCCILAFWSTIWNELSKTLIFGRVEKFAPMRVCNHCARVMRGLSLALSSPADRRKRSTTKKKFLVWQSEERRKPSLKSLCYTFESQDFISREPFAFLARNRCRRLHEDMSNLVSHWISK